MDKFENFKQLLIIWKESHLEEYDSFEKSMNKKDFSGYGKIFQIANSILPEYKKLVSRKFNQGFCNDISDLKILFFENGVSELLGKDFNQLPENSIIPAILYWLFLGNAYERMVEKGEELRRYHKLDYYQKQFIISIINKLIESSISSGLRTEKDWEKHFSIMQLANSDGGEVLSWALNKSSKIKKEEFTQETQVLSEYLWVKIEHFIETKNSEYDLACLKIALEEASLLNVNTKLFRTKLNDKFGSRISIIGERGIQKQYRLLNTLTFEKSFIKDLPENRNFIEQIKNFLSD